MTTTTRIAATALADTSYTFSVADGASTSFAADSLSDGEEIIIERQTAAGGYVPITYINSEDRSEVAKLTKSHSTIKINGPVDGRLNKKPTEAAVAVVEYS